MIIRLERKFRRYGYTIGRLLIGDYSCDTLEDTVREGGVKIPHMTAIPAGRYEVVITQSPRFRCPMPLLLNVPGFSGVRIHWGNTAKDTDGCILVGENKAKGQVLNSRKAYRAVQGLLKEHLKKEKVYVDIVNL